MVLRYVLRHRSKTPSPKKKQKITETQPNSVHAELSAFFRAYSVFRPALANELDLFQVVFINSSASSRSRSPEKTTTNLKELFTRLEAENACPNPVEQSQIDQFLNEFQKVRTFDTCSQGTPLSAVMTVSESSLISCGATINCPSVACLSAGYTRDNQNLRQVRVSDISSEEYFGGGGGIKKLIWQNADALFQLILTELDISLGGDIGDRSLMAIVTKKILANVGVSRSKSQSVSVGFSASEGTGKAVVSAGVSGSDLVEECYDDHSGVSAIHFILFPVEKTEKYKWRFYRGIDVCNSERDEDASDCYEKRQDCFYNARMWHQQRDMPKSHTISDYTDVEGHSVSEDGDSNGDNLASSLQFLSSDFKAVTHPCPSVCSYDVHISNTCAFAVRQCQVAAHRRAAAKYGTESLRHSVRILRSALTKCCFEATVRALYDLSKCYRTGRGLRKEEGAGQVLRHCARGLRSVYSSRLFYCRLLASDAHLPSTRRPELRIVELMTSAWPLRTYNVSSTGQANASRGARMIMCGLNVQNAMSTTHSSTLLIRDLSTMFCQQDKIWTRRLHDMVLKSIAEAGFNEPTPTVLVIFTSIRVGSVEDVLSKVQVLYECFRDCSNREIHEKGDHHCGMFSRRTWNWTGNSDVQLLLSHFQAISHPQPQSALVEEHGVRKRTPTKFRSFLVVKDSVSEDSETGTRQLPAHVSPSSHGGFHSSPQQEDLWVPQDRVSDVVGMYGAVVKSIQERSGAVIQVCRDTVRKGMGLLIIFGTVSQRNAARKLITSVVEKPEQTYESSLTITADRNLLSPVSLFEKTLYVPAWLVGHVVGYNGKSIRLLQMKSGARITVMPDQKCVPNSCMRSIHVYGTKDSISVAHELIAGIVMAVKALRPPDIDRQVGDGAKMDPSVHSLMGTTQTNMAQTIAKLLRQHANIAFI